MRALVEKTPSLRAWTRIAAFQHARLTTIQAFGDGNSRTSRAISDHLLTLVSGRARSKTMDRQIYFDGLEAALGKKNLAPLSDIFSHLYGLPQEKNPWVPSPFRTTNSIDNLEPLRRLKDSFLQDASVLEEDPPRRVKWIKQKRWESALYMLGGKPTSQEPACRKIWEDNRETACSQNEFERFLRGLEKRRPVQHGIFGKEKEKQAWQELRESLLPPIEKLPELEP